MIARLMRLFFFSLILFVFFSCLIKDSPQSVEVTYWANLQDSFHTKNLRKFVVNEQLENRFSKFHTLKNTVVDSVISYGTPFLYSWQANQSGLSKFTTFVYDEEHGSRIIYFIFDSRGKFRSATQVASKAGEGGVSYETCSWFTGKDTLYKIAVATTKWDLTKPDPWSHKLSMPKADSTFVQVVFHKDGTATEQKIEEKRELNPE